MKNLTHFSAIAVVSLLLTLSGCASSGGTAESTETASVTAGDTLGVASSGAIPADTVTTADGDTVSTPEDLDAAQTISGSTETTSPSRRDFNTIEVEGDASERLANYLRRVAGVNVIGIGPNARVTVRGKAPTTIQNGLKRSNPLFVVDGMRWGYDYSEIYHRVNLSEVKSIRVLKGVEAAMYGVEGANGVIVITHFTAGDLRE